MMFKLMAEWYVATESFSERYLLRSGNDHESTQVDSNQPGNDHQQYNSAKGTCIKEQQFDPLVSKEASDHNATKSSLCTPSPKYLKSYVY